MKRIAFITFVVVAILSINSAASAGTPNPFNPDQNEYGLAEYTDGSLAFYGRLIPGEEFDKLPKFTVAQLTGYTPAQKDKLTQERILVFIDGGYSNCMPGEPCMKPVISHCWSIQQGSSKGELFTCTIDKAEIESLKTKLLSGKTFTKIHCQSALENPSVLAKLISPYLDWAKLVANEKIDTDVDGIPDYRDNCADKPNKNQADSNQNGVGDLCENVDFSYTAPPPPANDDDDEFQDDIDKCPGFKNTSNVDTDNDGVGDECDDCPKQAGDVANKGCPAGLNKTDSSGDTAGEPRTSDQGPGCRLTAH